MENLAVKDFREKNLGITEKSDSVDARVMSYMGWHKTLHPNMKGVNLLTVCRQKGFGMISFRTPFL